MSEARSSSARPRKAAPQLWLEHALLDTEVLPDRPGDGEAGAVGPAQDIDHVGDDGGDDLDVVGRHVGRAAEPVGRAEVGDTQPQRQDAVPVLVHGAGDPGERGGAGLDVEQLGRLQHGHREEAVAAERLGGGQRLQVRHAALLGELREDEARQQADGGAEPAHQVGDLLGVADPDEEQGASASPASSRAARSANCATRLASAPGTSASAIESSRQSTIETTPRAACLWTSSARVGRVAGLYSVAPSAVARTGAGDSAVKTAGSRWKRRRRASGARCPK